MVASDFRLKFSDAESNDKLKKMAAELGGRFYSFATLAGVDCPFAKTCKAWAAELVGPLPPKAIVPKNGSWRLYRGEHSELTCFAASQEVRNPAIRKQRQHNQQIHLLGGRGVKAVYDVIARSLPSDAKLVRVHVSGEFKTLAYFDAWLQIARDNPSCKFYAYTKSLPFWIKRMGEMPDNFILTASYGGTHDELIAKHNLRSAIVVNDESEAENLGLPIDHDDSHAANRGGNFALLVHGPQAAGSERAKIIKHNNDKVRDYRKANNLPPSY